MTEAKKARVVSDGTAIGTHVYLDDQDLATTMLITKISMSIDADGLSQVTLHADNVETDITVTDDEGVRQVLRHQIVKLEERIAELEAAAPNPTTINVTCSGHPDIPALVKALERELGKRIIGRTG